MNINLFALSGLLLFFTSSISTILAWSQIKNRLYLIWGLLNFTVAIWGFSVFKFASTMNQEEVFFWLRFGHTGVIFISVFFLHFVLEFLDIKKTILIPVYILGVIFSVLNITDWLGITKLFIVNLRFVFNSFYVDSPPGLVYPYFVAFFWVLSAKAFYHCVRYLKITTGYKKMQLKYFILAMSCLWCGGTAFLMVFGIDIYPWPHWISFLYPVIIAYATLKYHLLDIKLVLTRAGILIAVYFLVLGIPFLLWYKYHLAQESLWTMLVLATVGPFIFNYFCKKAEDIIYKEENLHAQEFSKLSTQIILLKDVNQLGQIVVKDCRKIIQAQAMSLYVKDKDNNFKLICHDGKEEVQIWQVLVENNLIIHYLNRKRVPITYEDLTKKDEPDIAQALKKLGATVAIPCMCQTEVTAFILLGPKETNEPYDFREITALNLLANQIALEIEHIELTKKHGEYVKNVEKQEQIKMQKMLVGVSRMLPQINEVVGLLQFGADLFYNYVKSKKTIAFLHSKSEGKYICKLYRECGQDVKQENIKINDLDTEDSLVRLALQRKEAMTYKNIQTWAQEVKTSDMEPALAKLEELEGDLVLPLLASNNVLIGVFILGQREDDKEYSQEDIDNLMAHAGYLALAMQNVYSSQAAITDGFTGLLNKEYFNIRFLEEVNRAIKEGTNLGLIIMDIDWFKRYNDTYGHLAGDKLLKTFSAFLRRICHSSDLVFRYGGEEFVYVFLRNITLEDLRVIAQRITEELKKDEFLKQITLSIGVVFFNPNDYQEVLKDYTAEIVRNEIIKAADSALYEAKETGRNRTIYRTKIELKEFTEKLKEKKPLILILEDEPVIRAMLRLGAETEGFEVIEADMGKEAMRLYSVYKPDCCSIDLGLPDIPGEEVITFVLGVNPKATIFVPSLYEERKEAILKLGAKCFFSKKDINYFTDFRAELRKLIKKPK